LPQSFSKKKFVSVAGLFGFFSGIVADLDMFIRSTDDPLLFLEFHRQFTHSLIFIPIGGVICSVFFFLILGKRWEISFKQSVLFCTLGYATHPLLDACTSYGTMLLWPFSYERISWDNISIIDPLFTIPILILILIAGFKKKQIFARIALTWVILYLMLGIVFRNSVIEIGKEIAVSRGHTPLRLKAEPSFGNIFLWKIIYENSGMYYVDAVRTVPSFKIFSGESVQKLNIASSFPWLDMDSQQAKDIERFRWFSNDYLAQDKVHKNRIIDIRFSKIPNRISPLWSIELFENASYDKHVIYNRHRNLSDNRFSLLWEMLWSK